MFGESKTDIQNNTYLARNNQLDSYVNFPYAHLTAFPTPADATKEVTQASLNTENSKFRQELFIKETELQELQIRFERLQMQCSEKEKVTSEDYLRRQYIVSQQAKKKRRKVMFKKLTKCMQENI